MNRPTPRKRRSGSLKKRKPFNISLKKKQETHCYSGQIKLPVAFKYTDLLLNPVQGFTVHPSDGFLRFLQLQGFTHDSFNAAFIDLLARKHAASACIFPVVVDVRLNADYSVALWVRNHSGRPHRTWTPFNKTILQTMLTTCSQPFVVVSLRFITHSMDAGHSNALLFNLKTAQVNHIEPYGDSMHLYNNPPRDAKINTIFQAAIQKLVESLDYHYFLPTVSCPIINASFIGPQSLLQGQLKSSQCSLRTRLNYECLAGSCLTWTLWVIHMRLVFFDDDRDLGTLLTLMINVLQPHLKEFLQEFLWQAYQELSVTEYLSAYTLRDYLTQGQEPETIIIYRFEEPQYYYQRMTLFRFIGWMHRFFENHPELMDSIFKDSQFLQAIQDEKRVGNHLQLANYKELCDLPGYTPHWSYLFNQEGSAELVMDIDRYIQYLNLKAMPITLHRDHSPQGYKIEPDHYIGRYVNDSAMSRFKCSDDRNTYILFADQILKTLQEMPPDALSSTIAGYPIVASLPNYARWKNDMIRPEFIKIPYYFYRVHGREICPLRVPFAMFPPHMDELTTQSYGRIMAFAAAKH